MADINTKYIRQVIVECENGTHMDDMDFSLDFFVYTNRVQKVEKKDLVRVVSNDVVMYFAVVDSEVLGRGRVLCRARITDIEPAINGMERPVVIMADTGIVIGGHCCGAEPCNCDCYDEGYRISFSSVSDIPKQDSVELMYGIITDSIDSYGEITATMARKLTAADVLDVTLDVNEGDKVVVLVNATNPNHALKFNGANDYVPFSTEIMGANGEYTLTVDDALYRVYGELMLVSGKLSLKL